jgi:putative solute:sodium symporter small subunit
MIDKEVAQAYWKANLRLIVVCLVVWAFTAYGLSMFLRPVLAGITLGGVDIGFWFSQQGSILTFIALVFFYSWRMNQIDKQFGMGEE